MTRPQPPVAVTPPATRWLLPGALGTLTLVLLVVAVWLGSGVVGGLVADHGRDAALAAGQRAATEFTTFDFHHADADLKRLQADTTPEFTRGFTDDSGGFLRGLQQGRVSVVGTATAAGIYDYTPTSAHVLVSITAQLSSAQAPQPSERDYRMDLAMIYRDGRWLADSAGFVA